MEQVEVEKVTKSRPSYKTPYEQEKAKNEELQKRVGENWLTRTKAIFKRIL